MMFQIMKRKIIFPKNDSYNDYLDIFMCGNINCGDLY